MAFNGGGTNVAGVKQRPQGVLTMNKDGALGISGTGHTYATYTVPAGKIWHIIAFQTYDLSFVGTISLNDSQLSDGTNTQVFNKNSGATVASAFNCGEEGLYLPAGWSALMDIKVDAYTSGDIGTSLIYQEMDA